MAGSAAVASGRIALVLLLALATCVPPAAAQLAVSNLLEMRVGSDPFDITQPTDRTDLYDGLVLGYARESLRLGLRFETDRNSQDQFEYATVTQRFAEWSATGTDASFRGRVGNVYTILGRGLIHRSFEVPAVVLDPPGPDSRYALSRDVDGALVEGRVGWVSGRGLAGAPGGGTISPGLAEALEVDRNPGDVSGGQVEIAPRPWARAGAAYLRDVLASPGGTTDRSHGTGFIEIDPLRAFGVTGLALPVYAEYAQTDGTAGDWFRFRTDEGTPHALYAGLNFLAGPVALAAEWKDYRDFRFGTNDPPSLVREHAFPLLNRNTHVLNASSEQGYQLEGIATSPQWGAFTVNLSRSDGRFGSRTPRFVSEYFELHVPGAEAGLLWGRGEATAFYERGEDEFVFITRREVFGTAGSVTMAGPWSATFDLERQNATRAPSTGFRDDLVAVGVQRAGLGSLGLAWERSTDPLQEEGDRPGEPRTFLAAVIGATIARGHEATLLIGSRRGGLACTAGTCYDVPAFRGVELRLTSSL